jgi:hypothetical protein
MRDFAIILLVVMNLVAIVLVSMYPIISATINDVSADVSEAFGVEIDTTRTSAVESDMWGFLVPLWVVANLVSVVVIARME